MKKRQVLVVLFLLAAAAFADTGSSGPLRILVIHTYHQDLPWTVSFQEGLDSIKNRYGQPIEFYSEYLDAARLNIPIKDKDFADYLSYKYRSIKIDAVLADSDAASRFVNEYSGFIIDVPKILYTSENLDVCGTCISLQPQYGTAVRETCRLALIQNAAADRLFIITSEVEDGALILDTINSMYIPGRTLDVEIFRNFSFQELKERVMELDKNTIVLFTPVVFDRTGVRVVPKNLLSELTSISRAPIYSMWSSLNGTGIIGGRMIDGKRTAEEMVRAVLDYLKTGSYSVGYNSLHTFMDWNAAVSHGISTDSFPSDSIVINKPQNPLVKYFSQIMVFSLLFIAVLLGITLNSLRVINRKNSLLKAANLRIEEAQKISEKLSTKDVLTGLINRRAAMSLITYEMNRSRRTGQSVSLLVIDIDHFKYINDRFGHEKGDDVLSGLAALLESATRDSDIVARWGGEEFVVLLPETNGSNSLVIADKLRTLAENKQFGQAKATISVGAAEFPAGREFQGMVQQG